MLALKLLLVPAFLLLISLAGRRWGPAVAGWLAGLPVLTGPILFLLALENGPGFAAAAATVSLSAVFGAVAFILTYARVCARRSPLLSLLAGLVIWSCAAVLLTRLRLTNFISLGIALLALVIAPKLFPRISTPISTAALPKWELPLRLLAGAAITLAVTSLAAAIGPAWSGMFAVFPVITIVLSVFSHRASGPAFTTILLRAMIWGLYALTSFCLTLAVLLPQQGVTLSFVAAIAVAITVQWALKSRLQRR
ncbi:MAG TPA: hypothetical protein VIJ43_11305 [Burkholderiales bacterium]